MSWRSVQLGKELCDQDKKILDFFGSAPVHYVGDPEFGEHLTLDPTSTKLILILNRPVWCSDIIKDCKKHLTLDILEFYISVNRYLILGNDTSNVYKTDQNAGTNITSMLENIVNELGFAVLERGHFDNDQGRYFNFVQPLTWIHGIRATN